MKLSKGKPEPYLPYEREYWKTAAHDSPLSDRLIFEVSPVQSWSFPRARLISFKRPTNYSLQFEFPTHSVRVIYGKKDDPQETFQLLKGILSGRVNVLCAYFKCQGMCADSETTLINSHPVPPLEHFAGVVRVHQIEVNVQEPPENI